MSFYSCFEGVATFVNLEDYLEYKNRLISGGWANQSSWIDEMGSQLGDNPFDDQLRQVMFHGHTQRNIHRMIDVLKNYNWEGKLVGASTDGSFDGWIIQGAKEETYNLYDWAIQRRLDSKPDDPDEEGEWQEYVMNEFIADPSIPPPSSIDFVAKED